ncbi:MAG: hypothetical protein EXX96DRAFT_577624 [Benjaminiella poitrasii]|nr:MAG: hypothetical protein EXX96DRAFT_577624 [Benjaminiella poitrasii]
MWPGRFFPLMLLFIYLSTHISLDVLLFFLPSKTLFLCVVHPRTTIEFESFKIFIPVRFSLIQEALIEKYILITTYI